MVSRIFSVIREQQLTLVARVHGRFLKQYLSEGSTMTSVERILILLTESGLAYGAIWVRFWLVLLFRVLMRPGIGVRCGVPGRRDEPSDLQRRIEQGLLLARRWLLRRRSPCPAHREYMSCVRVEFSDSDCLVLVPQAIYPMFIIVLVALKKSQMESSFAFTTHLTVNTRASRLRSPVSVTIESRSRSSRHASTLGRRAESGAVVVLRAPGIESLHSGTEEADTLEGLRRGSKEMV